MKNRLFGIAGVIAILLIGFLIAGAFSSQKEIPRRRKQRSAQQNYKIKTVHLKSVSPVFKTGGFLHAYNKISLFAEVSGILRQAQTPFRSGNTFQKNQVLLRIDDSVYRNNVLAQKSSLLNQLSLFLPDLSIDYPESAQKWQSYLKAFRLDAPLPVLPEPTDAKEKYFIASRNIYSLFYQVKSMEATLAKYTLRAPYKGVVTEANITPGGLVRAGQKLGEFIGTALYELGVPLNIHDLPYIKVGDPVFLYSEDIPGKFKGKISRINNIIERTSQTVQAYISVADQHLKDGMYFSAHIMSSKKSCGMMLPEKWLLNGHSVLVQKDSVFTRRPVHILFNQNDDVLVKGLNEGEHILAQEPTGSESIIDRGISASKQP